MADALRTIDLLNTLPIQGVKLQLLHVLSDSGLAELYHSGAYTPLSKEMYISMAAACIARLRPDIVLPRLTGGKRLERRVRQNFLMPFSPFYDMIKYNTK